MSPAALSINPGRRPTETGLLDDLCRLLERRWLDRDAERLGGLQVDHAVKLCWLLNRQVSGLCALEDLVHIRRRPAPQLEDARREPKQPAGLSVLLERVRRREPIPLDKLEDLFEVERDQRVVQDDHRVGAPGSYRL